MEKKIRLYLFAISVFLVSGLYSQSYKWISSTENQKWNIGKLRLRSNGDNAPVIAVSRNMDAIQVFQKWGTCFNELGWDALNQLSLENQEIILENLFSDTGDLRFSAGRIPMNANDYARDWYSCDEVDGDFQLKYFNIDRDKSSLIPYVRRAMKFNPDMTFWASPWSPPSWMKVNHYYSVKSSDKNEMSPRLDNILYEGKKDENKAYYPKQLAVNDYFIQDSRYLQTYADYFCRFISAYKKEGINISRVMFQNEPWAYTIYPGCAWLPESILDFNIEYLGPTLKKEHPDVELYLGTLNTNRFDVVDRILSDNRLDKTVVGLGVQWWSKDIIDKIRAKYPQYRYMQTESECGSGTFDWKAAEYTFNLINHYLGNGCEEYTFWNAILCDDGKSGWGWKQNALIRVFSEDKSFVYTPEYYAVKHFSNKITKGTRILEYKDGRKDKLPVMVALNPDGKYIVIAGNFDDADKRVTIKLDNKFLDVVLSAHSFNTFIDE